MVLRECCVVAVARERRCFEGGFLQSSFSADYCSRSRAYVCGFWICAPFPPAFRARSFPLRADGDSRRVNGSNGAGGNGNGGVEAQRYDSPLMKTSSFFGDDLIGEALEDTAASLSSSMPENLNILHHQHHRSHHHPGGGAFSTGASPSRGGGGGGGGRGGAGGVVGKSSPGPLDGSSLAAALQNQLSF